jgi:hypothetical protein
VMKSLQSKPHEQVVFIDVLLSWEDECTAIISG